MGKYKFEDIAINCTQKKIPSEEDKAKYIGLEHLDSGSLYVKRWGSTVPLKGEKLIMHKGDVLLGKRNAYLRRAAICPHDGIFSAHGMVLKPRTEVIDERFFPLFIASDYFFDVAVRISVGSLSPTVNWRDLREVEFELPTLEDQRKLADVLWAINDTKESYKELIAATDELVKSQFLEMFGDLDDPACVHKRIPLIKACNNADDIKCGPFGTQLNKNEYQTEGVAIWEIPQINSGFVLEPTHYVTKEKAEQLKAFTLEPGDIAMSRKGDVGKCALFPEDYEPGIIHSDVLRIRVDSSRVSPAFMMYQLHFSEHVRRQIELVSLGAVMAGINVTKLKNIEVHLPDYELQNQFVSFVRQSDKSKCVAHLVSKFNTHWC